MYEDYKKFILTQRRQKTLHTRLEQRLMDLLSDNFPHYRAFKEVQGLAGGRNDLIMYEYSGKKVMFEIFASATQVERDLLIMHSTDAEVKIAIVIDEEIDSKVFDKFIKQNPEKNYPYFFINELFDEEKINICISKLYAIIEKDYYAHQLLLLQQKYSRSEINNFFVLNSIDICTDKDFELGEISVKSVFVTALIYKFLSLGVTKEKLVTLGQSLSLDESYDELLSKIYRGMNIFLITDLAELNVFVPETSLIEFLNNLEKKNRPQLIISVNAVLIHLIDQVFPYLKHKIKTETSVQQGSATIFKNSVGEKLVINVSPHTNSITIFADKTERQIDRKLKKGVRNKYLRMLTVK